MHGAGRYLLAEIPAIYARISSKQSFTVHANEPIGQNRRAVQTNSEKVPANISLAIRNAKSCQEGKEHSQVPELVTNSLHAARHRIHEASA